MNQVITAEQAKKITGGRKPLVPVEYETAVNALQACLTLDEAKYWSDKADALAAWARIYRNDEAGRKSAALKLLAYRRMGEIARELQPSENKRGKGSGKGPGAVAILKSHGLSASKAGAATKLAKADKDTFQKLIDLPRPPSPMVARIRHLSVNPLWSDVRVSMTSLLCAVRSKDPEKLAKSLDFGSAFNARKMIVEISEWLDAFEQALPKESK